MSRDLPPALATAREAARALGSLALLPARAAAFAARRGRLEAELRALLAAPRAPDEPPAAAVPARPLRVFVSCAEASGETHAASFVRALRAELAAAGAPPPALRGLGGARLGALGVARLGDPVARAAMGADAARGVLYYLRLLRDVAADLRAGPPDVLVAVDSPALHVPLGRIARGYGVPVVHFVTPQYWGWAPWRVHAYREAVDLALSILPFEPGWFERRGVRVAHVGHPIQDALADVPATRAAPESRLLVLLPGSRAGVIARNLPFQLAVAARARLARPELEVAVAVERGEHQELLRRVAAAAGADRWARIEGGALHAVLGRARAALSVSGTVLLDVLHHRVPAVVVHRLRSIVAARLGRHALSTPWFASPNLLAGREVLPERAIAGAEPLEEIARDVLRALGDEAWRAACVAGLDEAARRLGPPGAARRAARHALALAAARGASSSHGTAVAAARE